MIHELKILEPYADAILSGDKAFEVRKNDRGYEVNDRIRFTVIRDGQTTEDHEICGKYYRITYIHYGIGLESYYVVLGIKECVDAEEKYLDIYTRSKQLDDLQWTRCEDNPPPESGTFIVTEEIYGKYYIASRKFSTNLSEVSPEDFSEGQSGWYKHSDRRGYWQLDNIVAWRPPILPFNPDQKTE